MMNEEQFESMCWIPDQDRYAILMNIRALVLYGKKAVEYKSLSPFLQALITNNFFEVILAANEIDRKYLYQYSLFMRENKYLI